MKQVIEIAGKQLELGLDKFVLRMPYPKKPKVGLAEKLSLEQIEKYNFDKSEFHTQMHYMRDMIQDCFKHHVIPTASKDIKRYNVFFDDGGLMFVLTVGFMYGTGVVNIEINPSKLNQSQWCEMTQKLHDLFNHGYHDFYNKAVVSHAEFFVDVSGEDIESIALIDNTRRTSTIVEGNTYLGKRGSPRVSFLYDKAKQLKLDTKLARMEARINSTSLRLKDLVEDSLFSPFGNELVVNRNQVHSIANSLNKAHFANHILEFGLSQSGINKETRKKIYKELQNNPVIWWAPEQFGDIHKQMLKVFMPSKELTYL